MILTGRDAAKQGKVLEVSPNEQKVIVEGLQHHQQTRKTEKPMGETGGIVKAESPIYACKVMLVPQMRQKPTRVGHKVNEGGKKSAFAKNAAQPFSEEERFHGKTERCL